MRVIPLVAVFSAALVIVGCDHQRPQSVTGPDVPSMDRGAAASWVLTTYYWDNGWVRQHAMDAAYLPADLRISLNASNWQNAFPAFSADFDDVYAWGSSDLPQGLIDDFGGEAISSVWEGGGGTCIEGQGASACLDKEDGVLRADVDQGSLDNGLGHFVSVHTAGPVIHGEFDVQFDFSLPEGFHQAPLSKTVELCLADEFWANAICMQINSGFYQTAIGVDQQAQTPLSYMVARTYTDDLQGKLRITRTRVHRGAVVESVTGSGSRTITEMEGDWRTFSFTARRYEDGTVDGQWVRIRRRSGGAADETSQGVVTCFTIVDDEVWLGGFATEGLSSAPPMTGVAWRVKDNGQGANRPADQISLQYTGVGMGYPAVYCANRPTEPDLNNIEAGDIRIKR